jgi:hypothetical protein
VDVLASFAEKHGITYTLLSDEGSKVIRELGLFNEHVYEHHAVYGVPKQNRHWGVPYPGTCLLDEQGCVMQKRFQQSYREREMGAAILEHGFGVESTLHGAEARAHSEGVAVRTYLDSNAYRFFQRLWLTVELTIDPGLHVYGHASPEGYILLSIDVAPIEGLIVGEPEFPRAHPYRVEGVDEELYVYEGKVPVSLPLTFTKEGDDQTIHVTVWYQACSATDCLLPSAVKLQLPLQAQDLVDRPRRK